MEIIIMCLMSLQNPYQHVLLKWFGTTLTSLISTIRLKIILMMYLKFSSVLTFVHAPPIKCTHTMGLMATLILRIVKIIFKDKIVLATQLMRQTQRMS